MTYELTNPQTIATLATSGILVHVEVNVWTATKQDKEISDEVTTAKQADPSTGRFVKHLLSNVAEHHALLKDRAAWYNWITRETFPWAGSWDYLPNPRIPAFMQGFNERRANTDALLDKFCAVYEDAIANQAFVQKQMFRREDYPTVEQVRAKFGVKLFTCEVPSGDFRNQIAIESVNQARTHFNNQLPNLIGEIMDKQTDVLLKLLTSISKSCTTEIVTDAKGVRVKRSKVYDSTIEQALELCDTYKQFNVTGDTRLEEARAALENILRGVNVDVLRESDQMRATVKAGVDDILSKFGVR
jgi:hypothetical protein